MTPEDRVLDHYGNPYHKGLPDKRYGRSFWSVNGEDTNEICGDWIQWWGRYDTTPAKRFIGLYWEGTGCCLSQAMASMLAEHCQAKRLYEVKAFTQDDMVNLIGIDFDPGRLECVMVAYHALMKALESHDV